MDEVPEEMKLFFNARVEEYDQHMTDNIVGFTAFYNSIGAPFPKTDESIEILDLGAGTGIELDFIFAKAPNAKVTAVDISKSMLNKLIEKYQAYTSQIETIEASYLTLDFKECYYDYVISVMSLHHLLPPKKIGLYEKIRKSLGPSGMYIEGDYIVSETEERKLLADFNKWRENNRFEDGDYHIDIPFSETTQGNTLRQAGFSKVEIIFQVAKCNIVVARS